MRDFFRSGPSVSSMLLSVALVVVEAAVAASSTSVWQFLPPPVAAWSMQWLHRFFPP